MDWRECRDCPYRCERPFVSTECLDVDEDGRKYTKERDVRRLAWVCKLEFLRCREVEICPKERLSQEEMDVAEADFDEFDDYE